MHPAIRRIRAFLYRDFAPATMAILILEIAAFIIVAVGRLQHLLVLDLERLGQRPWALLTYPLVLGPVGVSGMLALLFSGLWLWYIGGSMERTWGTTRFVASWVLLVVISGAGVLAGAGLSRSAIQVYGMSLPLSALTVSWGTFYPTREVLFFGFFPMKAQWIAIISAAFVFATYASLGWLAGPLSLLGSGAGWLIVHFFPGRGPRRSSPGTGRVRPSSGRLKRIK